MLYAKVINGQIAEYGVNRDMIKLRGEPVELYHEIDQGTPPEPMPGKILCSDYTITDKKIVFNHWLEDDSLKVIFSDLRTGESGGLPVSKESSLYKRAIHVAMKDCLTIMDNLVEKSQYNQGSFVKLIQHKNSSIAELADFTKICLAQYSKLTLDVSVKLGEIFDGLKPIPFDFLGLLEGIELPKLE